MGAGLVDRVECAAGAPAIIASDHVIGLGYHGSIADQGGGFAVGGIIGRVRLLGDIMPAGILRDLLVKAAGGAVDPNGAGVRARNAIQFGRIGALVPVAGENDPKHGIIIPGFANLVKWRGAR